MKFILMCFLSFASFKVLSVDLPKNNQTLSYQLNWEKIIEEEVLINTTWELNIKEQWNFSDNQHFLIKAENLQEYYSLDFELVFDENRMLKNVLVPYEFSQLEQLFISDVAAWIGSKLNAQEFFYRNQRVFWDEDVGQYIYSFKFSEELIPIYSQIDKNSKIDLLADLDGFKIEINSENEVVKIVTLYGENRRSVPIYTLLSIKKDKIKKDKIDLNARLKYLEYKLNEYSLEDITTLSDKYIDKELFNFLAGDFDDNAMNSLDSLLSDEKLEKIIDEKIALLNLSSLEILQELIKVEPNKYRLGNKIERILLNKLKEEGGVEFSLEQLNKKHESAIDYFYRDYVSSNIRSVFSLELIDSYIASFYSKGIEMRMLRDLMWFVEEIIGYNENEKLVSMKEEMFELFDNNDNYKEREELLKSYGLSRSDVKRFHPSMIVNNVDLSYLRNSLFDLMEFYIAIPIEERTNYKNFIVDVISYGFEEGRLSEEELVYYIEASGYKSLNRLLDRIEKEKEITNLANLSIYELNEKWRGLTGGEKTEVLNKMPINYETNNWLVEKLQSTHNSKRIKIILEKLGSNIESVPSNKDVLIEFLKNNERYSYRKAIRKYLGEEYV